MPGADRHTAPRGGSLQRTQQILDRCLLQQNRARTCAEYLCRQLGRSIAGVHDDPRTCRRCHDVRDEIDAASAGHAVVEDSDVGLQDAHSLEGISAVRAKRQDVGAVLLQEVGYRGKEGGMAVGDDATDAC